jgi:nucleoid-associated protein YgaU
MSGPDEPISSPDVTSTDPNGSDQPPGAGDQSQSKQSRKDAWPLRLKLAVVGSFLLLASALVAQRVFPGKSVKPSQEGVVQSVPADPVNGVNGSVSASAPTIPADPFHDGDAGPPPPAEDLLHESSPPVPATADLGMDRGSSVPLDPPPPVSLPAEEVTSSAYPAAVPPARMAPAAPATAPPVPTTFESPNLKLEPVPTAVPDAEPSPAQARTSPAASAAAPDGSSAQGGSSGRYVIPNRNQARTLAGATAAGASVAGAALSQQPQPVRVAQASSASQGATPATSQRQYVVQKGENFWSIAKRAYGSGRYYLALWYANRDIVPSPDALTVGTTIRVPGPAGLDRSMIEAASTLSPSVSPASEAPAQRKAVEPLLSVNRGSSGRSAATDFASPPYHIVRPHETLRSIARDRLGDSSREVEIRRMNQDQLGERDLPRVGMKLRLPWDVLNR